MEEEEEEIEVMDGRGEVSGGGRGEEIQEEGRERYWNRLKRKRKKEERKRKKKIS